MASKNVLSLRKHYHEFFNLGIMQAYDDLAAPNYAQNGKPSTGDTLKGKVATLLQVYEANVSIVHEIEEGNRVAIMWVSNSVERATNKRLDPMYGMNVYEFNDKGQVVNNNHSKASKL